MVLSPQHGCDCYCSRSGDDLPAAPVPAACQTGRGSGKLVLVLYGTEYGFSEEVGVAVRDRLLREGYLPRVLNARDYGRVDWAQEQVLLCVFSTSGDGVPPLRPGPSWNTCPSRALDSPTSTSLYWPWETPTTHTSVAVAGLCTPS